MGIRDKPIRTGLALAEWFCRTVDRINQARVHRSLDKDAPAFRSVQWVGAITSYAILGGLHHHYVRI
jgi:hypothetical protein